MIWLAVVSGIVLVLASLVLIPRVILEGQTDLHHINLTIRYLFFKLNYNSREKAVSRQVLGIKIDRKKAPLPPPKSKPEIPFQTKQQPPLKVVIKERRLFLDLLKILVRTVIRLVRTAKTEWLNLNIIIADEDRMLVGMLYGILQPLTIINKPPNRMVSIDADWMSDKTRLNSQWRLSVRLFRVVWVILTTLASIPYRRAFKAYKMMKAN